MKGIRRFLGTITGGSPQPSAETVEVEGKQAAPEDIVAPAAPPRPAAPAPRPAAVVEEPVSLDSLGLRFGTDKSSWHHDYLRFYERYFAPLKNKNLSILEIGVAAGGSLRVWENYFPHALIVGADVNPDVMQYARGRVFIEVIDQANEQDLIALGERHGPFDIVIEDGSHMWSDQIGTLKALFPLLTDDGIYIVEDLQTNYGALGANFRGAAELSCVEFLKKLTDIRVANLEIDIADEPDEFIKTYGRRINSINFYKHCCLLQNGYKSLDDEPIVPLSSSSMPNVFAFLAHIGMYGDRTTESSVVLGRAENQNIQGFTIRCRGIPETDFDYRARLQNGEWTDWAPSGAFVGTRYLGQDLSGFSVRLTGQSARDYHIDVVGRFRDTDEPVVVGNGEDCIPESISPLWGMQIAARKAIVW